LISEDTSDNGIVVIDFAGVDRTDDVTTKNVQHSVDFVKRNALLHDKGNPGGGVDEAQEVGDRSQGQEGFGAELVVEVAFLLIEAEIPGDLPVGHDHLGDRCPAGAREALLVRVPVVVEDRQTHDRRSHGKAGVRV
jgi:hypothetical protein